MFSLPVLLYHSISKLPYRLHVSPEHFEDQCRTLHKAGWRSISLAEAEAYFLGRRSLPKRTFLMTFDDGYLDNHVYAVPILQAYSMTATFFPVLGHIAPSAPVRPVITKHNGWTEGDGPVPGIHQQNVIRRNGFPAYEIIFCNWDEIRSIRDAGMDIAPHSMNHANIVLGPAYTGFYTQSDPFDYFSVPPEPWPWGMPCFRIGSSLRGRAFYPAPEMIAHIQSLVPQTHEEASQFLHNTDAIKIVHAALEALPSLGEFETEHEKRIRMDAEFTACQTTFQQELGTTPITYCWPWGLHCPEAIEAAKNAGFSVFISAFTGSNRSGAAHQVKRYRVSSVPGTTLLRTLQSLSFTPSAMLRSFFRLYS